MAIFKVNKNKNYTVMSNYHLKDKELSLKAKGLLSMMLSLPENWDYSLVGLKAICEESIGTINAIIHELEDKHYMKREKIYENGKIKDWVYNIYEEPNLYIKNQHIENLHIENQDVENKQQLNNNILNTNKLNINNKEIYKEICDYLNQKTNSNYKSTTASTQRLIKARLNDGFKVDDFKRVIDIKCSKWLNDEKMKVYLRPETLFGTKFESYLNEKEIKNGNNGESEGNAGKWNIQGTIL